VGFQRIGDAVRTADKTEVGRRYPRSCAVIVTLLWARNLSYDVESDGDGVAEAYLTNEMCLLLFLVLWCVPRSHALHAWPPGYILLN
jgi:hypothetical protein